jgi:prevent-host-death family protein
MKLDLPVAQAKARFAECIRRVERGEEIVLTRHGRPVARLVRLEPHESVDARAAEVREPASVYEAQSSSLAPRSAEARRESLQNLLSHTIWPRIPEELLDKGIDKRERERILGLDGDAG